MMKRLLAGALALALGVAPAGADYQVKDANGATQTIRAGTAAGAILPFATLVDPNAGSITYGNGAASSGVSGLLTMCLAASGAPSETNALLYFLSCDLNGNLRTLAIQGGAWNVGQSGVWTVGLTYNGEVITNPSASFSRPANTTAYASGQLVANSTTAGSVVPLSFTAARTNGGGFLVRRAIIAKSGASLTNAQFRLHLYTSSPTIANGDGATWSTTRSGHACDIDVTFTTAFTDGADGIGVPNVNAQIYPDCNIAANGGTTVYGLLEARAAYTPLSGETFTVILDVRQN
jgi:hypothetical protein